ncbi:hypothetical protein JM946_10260 [Steroidobacter sp. S1-65]|uniref:Phosphodiesterase n=1 Tax=Steroidobacter gossypii TaxID=2805490 RepID=A0ABS1WVY0_9GAMM|nr:hypothetical protein [Steroidobacter gossypii]MBM0105136.1 hypothetical protein [Steroidobacter gossypii]
MSFQIRPKLRNKLPQLLAGVAMAIGASMSVSADVLTTPSAPAAEQANRPARGMSMDKVEATYGAPTRREAAVGEPPITRWEYPGFVVYFEHHLVIHTVAIG